MNEDIALERHYSSKHENQTEAFFCLDCENEWQVEYVWENGNYWPLNEDDMLRCPHCHNERLMENHLKHNGEIKSDNYHCNNCGNNYDVKFYPENGEYFAFDEDSEYECPKCSSEDITKIKA